MCRWAELTDEHISQALLGEALTEATNADDEAGAKGLVRYEFYDVLVRIAYQKYVESGAIPPHQVARAFHRLINEHILPVLRTQKLPEWQPFRDRLLWCNSVNDVLDINLGNLRNLFLSLLDLKLVPQRFCIPQV